MATYTVRGVVMSVGPGKAVRIHHEEISNFVIADGTVAGMTSHAMDFVLAEGVSMEGIAEGQKVTFDFDVWWKPTPGYEITRIAALPDDTQLQLKSEQEGHEGHGHEGHGHEGHGHEGHGHEGHGHEGHEGH